jgi:hypothetical protein
MREIFFIASLSVTGPRVLGMHAPWPHVSWSRALTLHSADLQPLELTVRPPEGSLWKPKHFFEDAW